MADLWWISDEGVNTLKGVEGDASNPPILPLEYIVHFLRTIPAARRDFELLYPTMLVEEQTRLATIIPTSYYLIQNYQDREDAFMARFNKASIRTAGPRGGTRIR
jgi:hypothetical protein